MEWDPNGMKHSPWPGTFLRYFPLRQTLWETTPESFKVVGGRWVAW